MRIETVHAGNLEAVLPLMADYQRFYGAQPDAERNRAHFSGFIGDQQRGIQFLAVDEAGNPAGFATLYINFSSVSASKLCVMNDLFTVPALRGRGVGRALIDHCHAYAQGEGYGSLVWFTAQDNSTAQALYGTFVSAQRGTWYRYALPTSRP